MSIEKLDEQTERTIERFEEVMRDYRSILYTLDKEKREEARAALRSRIRELIEEARKEDAVVTVYCDGLSLRLARGQCYSAAVFGLGDTQVFLESETGRGDDQCIEDQFEAREGMRFYGARRFIND